MPHLCCALVTLLLIAAPLTRAADQPKMLEIGQSAPDFNLPGIDDKMHSLKDYVDAKLLVIIFTCNHCPYVIAVHERLSRYARDYAAKGVAVIGINSNDPNYKDADSFENMIKTAKEWNLPFPYVFDETQKVARDYDAVCTPDPYLYENTGLGFVLRYRGRLDDSWKDESQIKEQSLRKVTDQLLTGAAINPDQIPSMGCSIKWKELTPKK